MDPTFSISDLSRQTGLSYDTIRYYEKIGLLPPAKRQTNGQRLYNQRDLDRFVFITHLKRTHMPLREIRRYMALVAAQDYERCYDLLLEHEHLVATQLTQMHEALGVVRYKLNNYKRLMDMMRQSELGGDTNMEKAISYFITPQEPISSGFGAQTTAMDVLKGIDLTGKNGDCNRRLLGCRARDNARFCGGWGNGCGSCPFTPKGTRRVGQSGACGAGRIGFAGPSVH